MSEERTTSWIIRSLLVYVKVVSEFVQKYKRFLCFVQYSAVRWNTVRKKRILRFEATLRVIYRRDGAQIDFPTLNVMLEEHRMLHNSATASSIAIIGLFHSKTISNRVTTPSGYCANVQSRQCHASLEKKQITPNTGNLRHVPQTPHDRTVNGEQFRVWPRRPISITCLKANIKALERRRQ